MTNALRDNGEPEEITTDGSPVLARVIEDVLLDTFHNTEHYANNRVECDHGRLKARLRPMRGLKTDRTARAIIRGHAFIQKPRRGHYQLGVDAMIRHLCVAAGFDELGTVI